MDTKQLAEDIKALRDKKRELEGELKTVKAELDEKSNQMREYLADNAMDRAAIAGLTFSVTTETVPSVTDWNAFGEYIQQNNALYLLQRRPAAAAYRELLDEGVEIPGVEPFEKPKLNIRAG